MRFIPFDIVLFDLDGTLADTSSDLTAALNCALTALGRAEVSADAVRRMVGDGVRTLVRRGLAATGDVDEALIERATPIFLDHYEHHIADQSRAYPGSDAALAALADAGIRLAVCTNKPERLARLLLARLGWGNQFDAIVGGDTTAARKPDPAPISEAVARAGGGRAVLVGDSIADVAAAHAAGLKCVTVDLGFGERPADTLGADIVIDDYSALVPALRSIG